VIVVFSDPARQVRLGIKKYAALDFQRALARLEAVQSMSRKGDCWDNAVVERPKPEGAAVGSRSDPSPKVLL
jgi:hypothetical protein